MTDPKRLSPHVLAFLRERLTDLEEREAEMQAAMRDAGIGQMHEVAETARAFAASLDALRTLLEADERQGEAE